jgi:hypothetical protein
VTDTILVGPNPVATLVVSSGDSETLIVNTGPATAFFGDTNAIRSSDGNGIVAVSPNSYFAVTGENDLFACVAPGTIANLNVISGGLNFFLPVTSLTIPFGATTGTRIVLDGTTGNIEIFDSTNALVGVLSGGMGGFAEGLTVGKAGTIQAILKVLGSGSGVLDFALNNAGFTDPVLSAAVVGGTFAAIDLQGANNVTVGHRDRTRVQANSSDGASSANTQFVYTDDAGVDHVFMSEDDNGVGINSCQNLTASDPSVIGTPTTPTGPETWHDLRPLLNSFVGTVAGRYPPQYRKTADGTIEVEGFMQLPAAYNSVTIATLPAVYRPGSNSGWKGECWAETNVAPVGTPNCQIDTAGNLQLHNLPGGLVGTIVGIHMRYPLNSTGTINA